jgi:branched-chain amino acid aminotransferase
MAITAPLLWLDGAMVASSTAGAPLMGHAAQRGSLVFDVGSFHGTPRGPALFRAREHVTRFLRSARIVGLELAFDEATLVSAARRVVAESGSDHGLVRWSAFLQAREPDLVPRDHAAHVAVAAQMLQDAPRSEPIRVAVFDDARKAAPEVLPPDTKAAGAYLGPMLARKRAIAAGADDVVLLDRDGDIAEAPIANAFAVMGGVLWTPPLGRILPGITRDSVVALAREEGIAVREERLSLEAFTSADEAFLTATSLPIAPIGQINARALPNAPGPITTRLITRIAAARRGADPAHEEWLTYAR